QAILVREPQVSGRVVFIGDGVARVATSRGVVEAAASEDLAVGDLVVIRDRQTIKMHRDWSGCSTFEGERVASSVFSRIAVVRRTRPGLGNPMHHLIKQAQAGSPPFSASPLLSSPDDTLRRFPCSVSGSTARDSTHGGESVAWRKIWQILQGDASDVEEFLLIGAATRHSKHG
ncbi:MAG: hypothetical protein HQM00_12650, partial [Magnetococcales bacterium]|nr:hypothetical protein [Magnetococcales bacterium]